jgi:hypothetical protein
LDRFQCAERHVDWNRFQRAERHVDWNRFQFPNRTIAPKALSANLDRHLACDGMPPAEGPRATALNASSTRRPPT